MAHQSPFPRFRRSRHLVSYWRGRWFFVHNYATGSERTLPAATAAHLDFFDEWRTPAEFAVHAGMSATTARRMIATLVKDDFLRSSAGRSSSRESAMERWDPWNPAAGFFHSATRDVRFIDPIEGDRLLRQKAQTVPVPSRSKRYPGARTLDLPRIQAVGEFPRVLLSRRTWRQFSKRPLPLHSLATLLGLTGGVHHWAAVPGQGELALKTSPSGGSRHPIELYVWARRVEGLAPGLYHYAGDRHRLELVRAHRQPVSVRRYMPTQFWYEGAAAIVFFSAVYERYLWKYTYPRAYRATLIEAGHQCQTFCLVATWLGLAPFCTMALADSEIEGDLGLDGISESVLYAAGVGVRPPGDTVRANPAGFSSPRVRPSHRVVEPRKP